MEELKLLISMVADLPALAVWVLVGYLCYKIAVIGSIYGVIRLLIVKAHDVLLHRGFTTTETQLHCIDREVHEALVEQCLRLREGSRYIHMSDVLHLSNAIDKMRPK